MRIIRKVDKINKFISIFNTKTGDYVRTGVLERRENGEIYDTNVDPFMTVFPELIDIGIMGKCVNGEAGLCTVQCYQNAIGRNNKKNMSLEEYKRIIKQCQGKTFQVALGGAGDVDTHEDFEEILRITRKMDIIPNFTTSGIAMTEKKANICKELCGAVAVSEYHQPHTKKAIEMLIKAGVTTNLHYVLGNDSIDEAIRRLKEDDWYEGLNAVVFLLHKPVGLGSKENVLKTDDPKVKEFYETVDKVMGKISVKIGFDSCNVPALINFNKNIDPASIDTCEAGRWSMYIDSESIAMPCSFDNQSKKWGIDLKEHTIKEAWNSDTFESFRDSFRKSCTSCKMNVECKGGCPICDIVLCNRDEKSLYRIQ